MNRQFRILWFVLVFVAVFSCRTVGSGAGEQGATSAERPLENLMLVSWGDQIMTAKGDDKLDTTEKIQRSLKLWHDTRDAKTILWRASDYVIERFCEQRAVGEFHNRYFETVKEIHARLNPIKAAREATRANGQTLLVYLTIYDCGAPASVLYCGTTAFPWQDRFTIQNPQFQPVDRAGNYHYGVLEFAYPEARRFMVDRIVAFVKEFDTDGVYVCTRTHSVPALHADQFGFSPPVVEEYQRRYGINILTDKRFDYRDPSFNKEDQAVANWRRLRGEYLVQFFRELRASLPERTIYAGIPRGRYIGPPYGNMWLDWESLVREKLVDGLVLGVYVSKYLQRKLYVPHAQIGYLFSEDDEIGTVSREETVRTIYAPICRASGVKLFYNTGACLGYERRWFAREPALSGFMTYVGPGGGGQSYVEHDDALCFPDGKMTVEAFVNVRRHPTEESLARILSKYDHRQQSLRGWEWTLERDGTLEFRVNLIASENGPVPPTSTAPASDYSVKSASKIALNAWTHLATVYDRPAGQLSIYIDGKLDARRTIPPYPLRLNPEQDLLIGSYGNGSTALFDGMIDELRIVADALTFSARPSTPYAGGEPKTVALYHFDRLVEGRFPNAAPSGIQDATLASGGTEVVESMPGFGSALSLSPPEQ